MIVKRSLQVSMTWLMDSFYPTRGPGQKLALRHSPNNFLQAGGRVVHPFKPNKMFSKSLINAAKLQRRTYFDLRNFCGSCTRLAAQSLISDLKMTIMCWMRLPGLA
jgi:hypothetical protein